MQVPAMQLLAALNQCATKLYGDGSGYASDEEAILTTIRILEERERAGIAHMRAWLDSLDRRLAMIGGTAAPASAIARQVDALRENIADARTIDGVDRAEEVSGQILDRWTLLVDRLVGQEDASGAEARARLVLDVAGEEAARLRSLGGGLPPTARQDDIAITPERLAAYLSDRFGDPGLTVTGLCRIGGGYGKETSFFSADGSRFSGDYVIRRDMGQPILDNDSHVIDREYPVLRAAYDQGFPAPEPLWLDTDHTLLPGGDFIIMRRVAGEAGGGVFGPAAVPSDALVATLAGTVARLHALPPFRDLGDLSDSIRTAFWDMPRIDVTRAYIQRFQHLYRSRISVASPALSALYAWLYDNLPDSSGRPVLLHGDIGFHNMLLEEGRLVAVLDWEFAHIGDPAEDVAYVCNTGGSALDCGAFLAAYVAAGGEVIDPARLRFFRIWGQVRNATAAALLADSFARGKVSELKMAHVGTSMLPEYIDAACRLIAEA